MDPEVEKNGKSPRRRRVQSRQGFALAKFCGIFETNLVKYIYIIN